MLPICTIDQVECYLGRQGGGKKCKTFIALKPQP
jgi:hypothetical protein